LSEIRFDAADVADVRFVTSPLWETIFSLRAIADPGRHAVHLPWVREVRKLAVTDHLELLKAFAYPGRWLPDFLTPTPPGPIGKFADEIAEVRRTPPATVIADLDATAVRRPLDREGAALRADPAGRLDALCDAVEVWHDATIAPYWSRMQSVLDADIAYRSRQLATGGARLLFDTLHPTVRWAGDRLIADDPWDLDVDLRGRGLPLMPSIFVDRRVIWPLRDDWPPMAAYPARAVATLWERRPASPFASRALGGVLGTARARLIIELQAPATTTELAQRLEVSTATISGHLSALLAAGLVTRSRHGRTVLYLDTTVASALLEANGL
jgi:DNA-binding transcriptional ArsR family regulator